MIYPQVIWLHILQLLHIATPKSPDVPMAVPGAEVAGANAGLGPVALHHPTGRVALGEDAGAPGPSTAPCRYHGDIVVIDG